MKMRILCGILFGLAAVASAGGAVDFRTAADIRPNLKDAWIVSADGRSLRAKGMYGGVGPLKGLPDCTGRRFRLSLVARQHGARPGAPGHHWGISGRDAAGNTATFRADGSGFWLDFTSPRGTLLLRSFGVDQKPKFTAAPSASPHPYRIEVDFTEHGFAVSIDGRRVMMEPKALGPFSHVSFYSWNEDVEISDLTVTDLPTATWKPLKKPVLSVPSATPEDRATNRVYALNAPLSGEAGAVMYWVRRDVNGYVCDFLDATNGVVLSTGLSVPWATFKVRTESGKALDFVRRTPRANGDGDWVHLAFAWYPTGQARFFVNGLPYNTGFTAGERFSWLMFGNDLEQARTVRFRTGTNRRLAPAVEGFRVYRREVPNHEIVAAYRARMPFDLVFEESVFPCGEPVRVTAKIAPGGTFTLPNPVEAATNVTGTADIELEVRRCRHECKDPKYPAKVTRRWTEPVPNGVTRLAGLRVDATRDLATQPLVLPEAGDYVLVARVSVPGRGGASPYQRTLAFSAAPVQKFADVPPSDAAWQTGECLWSRTFAQPSDMPLRKGEARPETSAAGTYLEAGSENGDRLSCVIDIAPRWVGKPLLLEIDWPDDKARSMGLYLYKPTNGYGTNIRDRLQGGIQAGAEYPNTGRMQTQRYLVFFAATNMLFEARTMITNFPAAIAQMRLSALVEPLPVLAVRAPKGYAPRRFGHSDEDQTFYNNLNVDTVGSSTAAVLPELVRYLKYTGQNALNYSIARYTYTYGPVEGSEGNGMFPYREGEIGHMIRTLGANGIGFDVAIQLGGLPQAQWFHLSETEMDRRGALSYDFEGRSPDLYVNGAQQANFIHPWARAKFFEYVGGLIRANATNGVMAVTYPLRCSFGAFRSLKLGYEDWTMAQFVRETRTRLPKKTCGRAAGASRYGARYDFLTATNTPAVRDAWLRWRADKVTAFAAELAAFLRTANPDLKLIVGLGQADDADAAEAYVENGLDFDALAKIPNLGFGVSRGVTQARWRLFRGYPPLPSGEANYRRQLEAIRARSGAVASVICNGAYFETHVNTLDPKTYDCVFQDADVKPWGRHFLKELVRAVAYGDAQSVYTGQQPLGSLGSEDVVREFAKAYCALPQVPFADVPSEVAALVVRRFKAKDGTYFYLANTAGERVKAKLAFAPQGLFRLVACQDLSTGAVLKGSAVELKPYELRSFFLPGDNALVKVEKEC